MVGGELQLALNFESQDIYFTFRPKFSYYQKVYRRYERFAVETKMLVPNSGDTSLQNDSDTILNFKIPMKDGVYEGDLLKSMYLNVELPDIYSGLIESSTTSYIRNMPQDFIWIRELGTYLIKNAKLKIGGNVIQELFDEYQDVWKTLNLSKEEKKQYDILTGNTDDMNNPHIANGNEAFIDITEEGPFSEPVFVGTDFTYDELLKAVPYSSESAYTTFFEDYHIGLAPSLVNNKKFHRYTINAGSTPPYRIEINPLITSISNVLYKPVNSAIEISTFSYPNSSFNFSGNTYSKFYINSGNITFDSNDTTVINTITDHLSTPRITAYGGENHSFVLTKESSKNTVYQDSPELTLSYIDRVTIDFYNKHHFISYIFNHTDNTFERTDGANHGYSNNAEIVFTIKEDIDISLNTAFNVVNVTDSKFQITSDNILTQDNVSSQFSGDSSNYMYNPLNDTFERQDGQAHGKSDGDSVTFSFKNPPGFNLSPTVYYVRDSTSTTFKLAGTLGGSVITATGTNTVISGETFIYNDSTDTFQRADGSNHGFSNSQTITFSNIHSLLGGGSGTFNTSSNYTVVNKTDTRFQLMASSSTIYSGGSANQWKVSLNISRYMYNPVTHFFIREDGENHGYSDGDILQFIETPDWGFPSDSNLHVTSSDSTKFKLSTSATGTPILVYSSGSITTDGVNQFVYNSTNDTFERADGSAHGLSVDDTISFTAVSPRGVNSLYSETIYETLITYVVTNISGITFRISPKSTGSDTNLYIYDTLNNTLKRSDGSAHGFSNGGTFTFSSLVGIAKTVFDTGVDYNIVNTTATTFQLALSGQTAVISVVLGDDDMLLGREPVFVMYNPETSFWKREDESSNFISNDIKVKFTTSGTGFTATFDTGSEYYIVNTSNNQFQLSSSSGGSAIQTTEVPTVSKFNGVLSFDSTTNTYQRADGLPHGFTENEGIDLKTYPLTNQTDGTSITKNNFIISTKNVTSTTFQLVVIDLQNNTETLLATGSSTLNITSRVYSLELFFETSTTGLTTAQITTLNTNDTNFNKNKNSIIFKSFNVDMSENTLNNVTSSNKSNRPNKPIGISLGSGGNNADKVLLFTPIHSHDLSEVTQRDTKLITTHYPYAKRFYNESLMRTERQFTTFSRSTTFSFEVEDPKETTYATKQSKGFNIIDSGLDSIGDNVFPSIQGRTLKIPLYFYFQKDIKKALPLIALTKNNPGVEIEITLRPIRDLYLSRFCPIVGGGSDFWNNFPYELQNSVGYYIKNNINNNYLKTTGIQYFLGNNQTSPNTNTSGSELTKELDKFSINPQLEYNIIYLDKEERQRLKTNKYQYFIENVRKIELSNKDSQENRLEIKLKVNKPLKELIFIPKRNDTKELNQWDNFTNYVIPNISTTSYSYTSSGYLTMFTDDAISHSSINNIYNSTKSNFPYPHFITKNEISKKFYEKDIIKKIRIDSTNDSFKKRKTLEQSGTYYNHQQPSEYYKKKPKDGVYIYSFSLNPQNSTPTGEKMKDFNYTSEDFNIIIDVSEKPNKENYDLGYDGGTAFSEKNLVDDYFHEINLYSVEYNILEINNEEANLLFS